MLLCFGASFRTDTEDWGRCSIGDLAIIGLCVENCVTDFAPLEIRPDIESEGRCIRSKGPNFEAEFGVEVTEDGKRGERHDC